MRCALFGKLPSKRDFIALHAPRSFLSVWEPWMQSGISASRQHLGPAWQQAFLQAPIWRFWLGADLCGAAVLGAFMSSLDGVGRYYPLTVFAWSDEGAPIPPPEFDAQEEWFAAAEEFLLSTLAPETPYEHVTAALDQLGPPSTAEAASSLGADVPSDGVLAMAAGGRPFTELFASLRVADQGRAYAGSTYWWTIGGEGFEPLALSGRHMPEPLLFADMLTGRFGPGGDLTNPPLGLTDA